MADGVVESDITDLVRAWCDGDLEARDRLAERIYPRLRELASQQLARRSDISLQVTELVHELYLALVGRPHRDFRNRAHFLAISALRMRQILVDHARRRAALKRGADVPTVDLDAAALEVSEDRLPEILIVHDALDRLAATNGSAAQVLELRLFGGLTFDEVASVLGIGEATAVRRFRFARAWLKEDLGAAACSGS
jgi:RNA polymerase sigma factor (TIGR02999 family)